MSSPVTAIVRTLLRKPGDQLNIALLLKTGQDELRNRIIEAVQPHNVIPLKLDTKIYPPSHPDLDAVIGVDVNLTLMSQLLRIPFVMVLTGGPPANVAHLVVGAGELEGLGEKLTELCSKTFEFCEGMK